MDIKQAIENIKENASMVRRCPDEYIFGMVCYKYFYNGGEFGNSDFESTFVDGRSDGGIDLIGINDDEDNQQKSLVLIQSKYGENIDNEDIKNAFSKMIRTIQAFKIKKTASFNDRLKKIYTDKYDEIKDDNTFSIELVVFLGKSKIDTLKIKKFLDKNKELENYDCNIYNKDEISQQIKIFEEPKRYVNEGKVKIFNEDGKLQRNKNGLMANISANSLKDLFNQYKNEGLFEQNFRYYIKAKKIDKQIKETLNNKISRKNFWFLNNGIIIGCKDFRIDGNNIKLEKFSIINGCQTTTLIGEDTSDYEGKDFAIHCKFVKPPDSIDDFKGTQKEKAEHYEERFDDFISKIAEASNSQKPIKDRDLKANAPEQRKLKKQLQEKGIHLEIKRGEKIPSKLEKYQKLKNDLYGQLFLAFVLQQPGTARNSKAKVFSSKETYESIFHKEPNNHLLEMVVDLSKLHVACDEYGNDEDVIAKFQEIEKAFNIAKQGKFFVIAIIGFLIKYYRKSKDVDKNDEKIILRKFYPDKIPDDHHEKLRSLFDGVVDKLVDYSQKDEYKVGGTFWKTDRPYLDVVIPRLKIAIEGFYKEFWKKAVKDCFKI